jgi:peroxiredoxin
MHYLSSLATTLLICAACSASAAAQDGPEEYGTGPENSGTAAPILEDRESLDLDGYLGKVLAIELGGVGCPLTGEIYLELLELRKEYPGDVAFLRVDFGQSIEETRRYYEKYPPSFDVIGDPSGNIGKSFPSQAFPTLYLYGKWGRMRYMGGYEPGPFRSMINRLLMEKSADPANFFTKKLLDKGDLIPAFRLPGLSGEPVAVHDHRKGSRAFVLVFGGTGCPISSQAVKQIGIWSRTMKKDGLSVLTVNVGEGAEAARAAYQPMNLPFPVLIDEKSELLEPFGIETVPTVFVADASGRVVLRSLWNSEAVRQEVDILLGRKKSKDRKKIEQQGSG